MRQDIWGMMPMQGLMYPSEYHDMYGYMYPVIEPEIYGNMVYPPMYPDIYYKVYPYVCKVCEDGDNPFTIYPTQVQVESMINECYDLCVKAMPELEEYSEMKIAEKADFETIVRERPRRPMLRDLIAIILLFELFRRRDRNHCRDNFFGCGGRWY